MTSYLLCHAHAPAECAVAFAAWKGFQSHLRHHPAVSSCAAGGHRVWWKVEADDAAHALALLPRYVAARTEALEVSEVLIP